MRGILGVFIVCMLVFSALSVGASHRSTSVINHIKPVPITGDDEIKIGSVIIDGDRKLVSASVEGTKLMGETIGVITKSVSGDFSMHVNYNVDLIEDGLISPPDVGVVGVYRMQGAKEGKNLDMKTFMKDASGRLEYPVKMDKIFYWDVFAFLGIYGILENLQINLYYSNLVIAGVVCAKLGKPIPQDIESKLPRYVTYVIDWGDGSRSIVGPQSVSKSGEISHKYRDEGRYTIRIRIVAKTIGNIEIAHFTINVGENSGDSIDNGGEIRNTYLRWMFPIRCPSKLKLGSLLRLLHLPS